VQNIVYQAYLDAAATNTRQPDLRIVIESEWSRSRHDLSSRHPAMHE
jgi:hypothetical protein